MIFILIEYHVVFIKLLRYFFKIMFKSANHNIRFFVRRIHSIVICIVVQSSSFNKKEKSLMKMLKNKRSRMEPQGTPAEIFSHLLNLAPTFFCRYLLVKSFSMKFEAFLLKLSAFNLERKRLWFSVSNAFQRSVIISQLYCLSLPQHTKFQSFLEEHVGYYVLHGNLLGIWIVLVS